MLKQKLSLMTCALQQRQELANYAEERGMSEKDILPQDG